MQRDKIIRRVQRTGKAAIYVTIPLQIARLIGIHYGSYVEIDMEKSREEAAIIIRPVRAPEVSNR